MTPEDIYKNMEGMFGLVLSFFKFMLDSSLQLKWELFRKLHVEAGPIPNKHRESIEIGVAAVTTVPIQTST